MFCFISAFKSQTFIDLPLLFWYCDKISILLYHLQTDEYSKYFSLTYFSNAGDLLLNTLCLE